MKKWIIGLSLILSGIVYGAQQNTSSGEVNHAALQNRTYSTAGHYGFASSTDTSYINTLLLSSFNAVDTNYTPLSVHRSSMNSIELNYQTTLSSFNTVDKFFLGKDVHNSSMTSIEANYTTTLSSFNKVDGVLVRLEYSTGSLHSVMMSSFSEVTSVINEIILQSSGVAYNVFNTTTVIVDTNFTTVFSSLNTIDNNFNTVYSSFNTNDKVLVRLELSTGVIYNTMMSSFAAAELFYGVMISSFNKVDTNFNTVYSSFNTVDKYFNTVMSSFNTVDQNFVDKASAQNITGVKTVTSSFTVVNNISVTDVFATSQTSIYMYSIDRGSVTNFNTADGYEVVAGTRVVKEAGWFESTSNGAVKYVGKNTREFHISGFINGRCTNSNDIHCVKLYKNADELPETYTRRLYTNTSTDYGSQFTETTCNLTTNDVISLKVANQNATNGYNLFTYHIFIHPTR